jgi:hypothetical protein
MTIEMNIIKDRVWFDGGEALGGFHNAGCIEDVLVNWPQHKEQLEEMLPAYYAEKKAAEIAEAERLRLQAIKDKEAEIQAELDRVENERKAKEALQKQIDDAVQAALAAKNNS